MRRLLLVGGFAASAVAALATASLAAERAHDAHVHGIGKLNLAVEAGTVEMELEIPGHDAVGFEHVPRSAADREAVKAAAERLRKGEDLFRFPDAAGCRLTASEVRSPGMEASPGHEVDERLRDGGHEPNEADVHEHGHVHDREEPAGPHHSEFTARYSFVCASPEAVDYVETRYFELFPASERLDVQAITAGGQSLGVLTANESRLKLR